MQPAAFADLVRRVAASIGMLAVFDVDGTLCDTQGSDGLCFGGAVEQVTGRSFGAQDWTAYDEPTGTAIARELLAGDPDAGAKEAAIKAEFLRRLEARQPLAPDEFKPLPGAAAFVARLRREAICDVAIATGCFDVSARFKLRCCGIDLDAFPHATSSDAPRRRDIIRLAVERAGYDLSRAVFFGDGAWDVHATRLIGVPMIGIGRKTDRLRALGVEHVFRDYTDAGAIIAVLTTLVDGRPG